MSLVAVLAWLATVLLLAALALPLAAWAFADWPDRGVSLAPAVGLAVLALIGFWVGHLSMGFLPIVAGVLALGAASALAVRAGVDLPTRSILAPLAVFLGAFALYLLVGASDPAVTPYAGEQFLDVGLIYAVRRAQALPPQDVWFAGESLRYYYAGPLLAGLLSRVTDTPVAVAYNLMGPTVFAAFVAAAYGLAGAVASARGTGHRLAGVLGALLVAFAGTLATPLRGLSSFLPRDLAAEYGDSLYGGMRMAYEDAVDTGRFLGGDADFGYWHARHVIPDAPNVFPFWTYVNGDLRPHMYAGPFVLLAAALAFAYYRTPAEDRTRRRLLLFGTIPAAAGLLGLVNTFDLPAVVGLAWLAALFARADPWSLLPDSLTPDSRISRTGSRPNSGGVDVGSTATPADGRHSPASWFAAEGWRVLGATLVAAVVALLAVLWAAPVVLLNSPVSRGVALLGPTSNLGGLLLVFGGFLVAFALWLGPVAVEGWSQRRRVGLVVGLALLLALATLLGYPAVGLFVPLVVGGWWLLRTGRARSFAVVLAVAGAGLVLVPEFAYARVWPYDPNAPRWNTIYKITIQVWTVWGVAGGVALAAVLGRAGDILSAGLGTVRRRPGRVAAGVLALALVGLLATFPAFALASQYDDATGADGDLALSLNGTAGPAEGRSETFAAARWLREETTGQPTMVSRPAGSVVYTWDAGANAASTFSGVPTVVGWEHVAGYHGVEPYEARLADVEAFYTGNATAVGQFVREYDVRYVYVGPAEREAFGSRAFAEEFPWMTEVYRNDRVRIFEVDRTAMPDPG